MADVFLAQDLKYERAVALKVLRPELSASLGAARFLQEIQIAARLHHPHILPLYDSDEADGLLYYVMPYVEGESLRARLARERQLPVDEALQIAREVADALSYAHSCGVVHRDIKPANILQDAGHAVVADFGIARAIGVASAQSLTGPRVIGTLAYMSPEQAEGSEYLDGRSDVYSLGCVLFEMLVGQPPFAGNTLEAVIANRLTSPIGSLRAVRELVPEAVDAAVKKALATLPADRFMSAARFAEALGTPVTVAIAVGTAQAMLHDITVARSVAVLPFENMSADPENEYFSDGVTDDIISTLSKIAALKVVCRTSTMQYKKTARGLPRSRRSLAWRQSSKEASVGPGRGYGSLRAWSIHGPRSNSGARRTTASCSTFSRCRASWRTRLRARWPRRCPRRRSGGSKRSRPTKPRRTTCISLAAITPTSGPKRRYRKRSVISRGPSPRIPATRWPTLVWPTPTSSSASGSAPSPRRSA